MKCSEQFLTHDKKLINKLIENQHHFGKILLAFNCILCENTQIISIYLYMQLLVESCNLLIHNTLFEGPGIS